MLTIELSSDEVQAALELARTASRSHRSVEDREFLAEARVIADELPRRLRLLLNDFRLREPSGAILIRGIPVDETFLVPTPTHWKNKASHSPTIELDLAFCLIASLLGDPVGWSTQQDGYIMHDVFPIRGCEWEQLGAGSKMPLTWHTEDSFHPYRADYIGLMCLRNPDNVATTVGCLEELKSRPEMVAQLGKPTVCIRPDESHLPKNRPEISCAQEGERELLERAYERIVEFDANPPAVRTLFGDPARPYFQIDPYFAVINDSAVESTFKDLVSAIDEIARPVRLQPGEIVFLDNYLSVHGRESFVPRYDGKDRWLKRLNIVRDLRKSRDARLRPEARVIY